ncbi:hypothetical protein MKW92_028592, partial [Papaver armeniacum]
MPKDVNDETGICTICQAEYERQERVSVLKCGYEYHTDCIRQWLMEKNFCPIYYQHKCTHPPISDNH